MTPTNEEIVKVLSDLLRSHEALMPGVRFIALQDYALLNDAPIEAKRLIARLEGK